MSVSDCVDALIEQWDDLADESHPYYTGAFSAALFFDLTVILRHTLKEGKKLDTTVLLLLAASINSSLVFSSPEMIQEHIDKWKAVLLDVKEGVYYLNI